MPEFDPEQTLASELIIPPTVAGSTVIVTSDEFELAQTPDCRTALYFVVVVRFKYAWVVVVFAILVVETKLSVELSQRTIDPVWPDKVKVPELEPEQTVASELTVPPTVDGLTVIVASEEFALAQLPEVITALYFVVTVKLLYA